MCECVVGGVLCVVVWFGLCVFVVAVCVCALVLNKPLFAVCVRFIM